MSAATMSRFGSATGVLPLRSQTLAEVIEEVRSDTHASKIRGLRAILASGDESNYHVQKGYCACVTPCARFKYREGRFVVCLTALAVIDLDHLSRHGAEPGDLKRLLRSLGVVAEYVSPSGDGIKAFFAGRLPDEPMDWVSMLRWSKDLWQSASDLVAGHWPDIDPSGCDVTRLCFLSHDDDANIYDEHNILGPVPFRGGAIEGVGSDERAPAVRAPSWPEILAVEHLVSVLHWKHDKGNDMDRVRLGSWAKSRGFSQAWWADCLMRGGTTHLDLRRWSTFSTNSAGAPWLFQLALKNGWQPPMGCRQWVLEKAGGRKV